MNKTTKNYYFHNRSTYKKEFDKKIFKEKLCQFL